jgi:hypothetical protein
VHAIHAVEICIELSAITSPDDEEVINEAAIEETRSRRRAECLADEKPHEEIGYVRRWRDTHREAFMLQIVGTIEAHNGVIEDPCKELEGDSRNRKETQQTEADIAWNVSVQGLYVTSDEVDLFVGVELR